MKTFLSTVVAVGAAATLPALERAVGLEVGVENALLVFSTDSDTLVGDAKLELSGFAHGLYP